MRPAGGWGVRAVTPVALAMMTLAGCGMDASTTLTGDPLRYLITIDQLVVADFTVSSPAAHVDADTLAQGDPGAASALAKGGLQSAATVEYQRNVEFITSNGPLDVVATVERFASASGASSVYGGDVRRLDALPGAIPASTGPLGDQAHAISTVKTTSDGFMAVEITVEWRVGNLVNIIVARGRYGGTRLDDALVLAAKQTANEVGGTP